MSLGRDRVGLEQLQCTARSRQWMVEAHTTRGSRKMQLRKSTTTLRAQQRARWWASHRHLSTTEKAIILYLSRSAHGYGEWANHACGLHPMRGAPRCCLFKPHLASRISDWAQKDSLQRISCASQLRHEATALSNVLYGGMVVLVVPPAR
jgi:hypothetical protein